MHREVRGVGHEASRWGEESAGEVEALFDVDGDGGPLEGATHLLRDAHEVMGEDRELDGIADFGPRHPLFLPALGAHLDADVAVGGDVRGAPGLHNHGGDIIDEDRRPRDGRPGGDSAEQVEGGVDSPSVEVYRRHQRRGGEVAGRRRGGRSVGERGGASHRAHAEVVHDERAALEHEPKLAAVRGLKGGGVVPALRPRRHDRDVGAVVAEVEELLAPHGPGFEPLRDQSRLRSLDQYRQPSIQPGGGGGGPGLGGRLLPLLHHVGEADAHSGQDPRVAVHEDRGHPEGTRDGARMLPPRAAEARQHVRGHVVALHLREGAYGPAHRLVRDADEPVGDLVHRLGRGRGQARGPRLRGGCRVHLLDIGLEGPEGPLHIQGLVLVRPEDLGKEVGVDAAEGNISVGDREQPTLAVAHWARVGPGALRPDVEAARTEKEPGPPARGHRADVELGCLDGHTRRRRFVHVLVPPRIPGDVGRRTAHVEPDDLLRPAPGALPAGGKGVPYHAARGPGEDSLVPREPRNWGEPAIALHERHLHVHEPLVEPPHEGINVAADVRGEVGVCTGSVPPRDHLDHRHHNRGEGNLLESHLHRKIAHQLLVLGEDSCVLEHDGDAGDAPREHALELRAHRGEVGRAQHAHRLARDPLNFPAGGGEPLPQRVPPRALTRRGAER
mmetsp:Transcript_51433/g.164464  ORF Transcript_51433/g.164464 Transcript_51433/m.164464 type:complete len:671 (-) Transcript_51433:531-2543(-)